MTGDLLGALVFAVATGTITFFSPCAYALLPGYVGYYVVERGGDAAPLSGAVARGGAAAVGVLLTLGALSGVAIVAGGWLRTALPIAEQLVGVALIAFGLALLGGGAGGVHIALPRRRSSVFGFGLFGALYALAATGCVLPVFLSVASLSVSLSPSEAALALGVYGGTVAGLMLGVTVATAVGNDLWTERLSPDPGRLVRLGGIVLVLAGIGQLYLVLG